MDMFIQQNWLTIVSTIISFLLGWLITHFYRNRKEITVKILSSDILEIDKFNSKINLLYEDKPISRLSRSEIYIWNSGKVPVMGTDIVMTNRFGFFSNSSIIWITDINTEACKSCGINIEQSDKCIYINFDYLDKNDGLSFTVIYDSINYPGVLGKIIGTKIKNYAKQVDLLTSPRQKGFFSYAFFSLQFLFLSFMASTFFKDSIEPISIIIVSVYFAIIIFQCYFYFFRYKILHTPPKSITKKEKVAEKGLLP